MLGTVSLSVALSMLMDFLMPNAIFSWRESLKKKKYKRLAINEKGAKRCRHY